MDKRVSARRDAPYSRPASELERLFQPRQLTIYEYLERSMSDEKTRPIDSVGARQERTLRVVPSTRARERARVELRKPGGSTPSTAEATPRAVAGLQRHKVLRPYALTSDEIQALRELWALLLAQAGWLSAIGELPLCAWCGGAAPQVFEHGDGSLVLACVACMSSNGCEHQYTRVDL